MDLNTTVIQILLYYIPKKCCTYLDYIYVMEIFSKCVYKNLFSLSVEIEQNVSCAYPQDRNVNIK